MSIGVAKIFYFIQKREEFFKVPLAINIEILRRREKLEFE
jgi:hypothetical protein